MTEHLRQTLRARRIAAGFSQNEIAEIAGVYWLTVQNFERGRFTPREPTLQAILKAVRLAEAWAREARAKGIEVRPTKSGRKPILSRAEA